jgi:type II secretory pathway component PulJ
MDGVPDEAAGGGTMTVPGAARPGRRTSWRPAATLPTGLWDAKREPMVVTEVMRWLHQHWDLTAARNQNPQGTDPRARARLLAWRLVRPCLERYFQEEQDLLANLVRAVDALAKRVDALAADQARLLGAVRSDLVDAVDHCEESIAAIGGGA